MRTILYNLLARLAENDLPDPIVEFGALRAKNQEHLPSVQSYFPGHAFSGVDMMGGIGVDQLHDLRNLGLRDGSIGTALLFDAIEHVEHPRLALGELRRCLRDDGILILTTGFLFPIHEFPADYWRFTAEGIAALLEEFPYRHARESGLRLFPHTVVGVGAGPAIKTDNWMRIKLTIDNWVREGSASWKERGLNVLPPVLSQVIYDRYLRGSYRAKARSMAIQLNRATRSAGRWSGGKGQRNSG